jgi:hypothetical protein
VWCIGSSSISAVCMTRTSLQIIKLLNTKTGKWAVMFMCGLEIDCFSVSTIFW